MSIESRSIEAMFVGRTFDDFLMRPLESVVGSRRGVSLAGPLARIVEDPGPYLIPLSDASRRESYER